MLGVYSSEQLSELQVLSPTEVSCHFLKANLQNYGGPNSCPILEHPSEHFRIVQAPPVNNSLCAFVFQSSSINQRTHMTFHPPPWKGRAFYDIFWADIPTGNLKTHYPQNSFL